MSRGRKPLWVIAALHFSISRQTQLKLMNPSGIINLSLQHTRSSHNNEVWTWTFKIHWTVVQRNWGPVTWCPDLSAFFPPPRAELRAGDDNKPPNCHHYRCIGKLELRKEHLRIGWMDCQLTQFLYFVCNLPKVSEFEIKTFLSPRIRCEYKKCIWLWKLGDKWVLWRWPLGRECCREIPTWGMRRLALKIMLKHELSPLC